MYFIEGLMLRIFNFELSPAFAVVPSMTTTDASIYYRFNWRDAEGRIKFAVKNLDNERAPIADGYNGFFSDVHSDLGKNYYVDLTLNF